MSDGKLGVWMGALLLAAALAVPGRAQEPVPDEADPAAPAAEEAAEAEEEDGGGVDLRFGIEAKAHFRQSDENRFRVNFPFDVTMIPPGQTAVFEETVDEGSHFELSVFTLLVDAVWSEGLAAHAKIDAVDLYDRNPTSGDKKLDVDEAWIRFGRETDPGLLPARGGAYLKIGKLPKFERQDDRHLESYGLLSTAFNRFEDTGVELGLSLGRHLYLKASATQGNPVFIRDPNALAGDNGTDVFLRPNPESELKSGIVILYDAEVEDLDIDGDLEIGGGLGLRFGDDGGPQRRRLLGLGLPAHPRRDRRPRGHLLRRRPRPAARPVRERPALPLPAARRRRQAGGRRQSLGLPRRPHLLRPVRRPGDRRPAAHRLGGRARLALRAAAGAGRSPAASSSPRSRRRCATRSSTTTSGTPGGRPRRASTGTGRSSTPACASR